MNIRKCLARFCTWKRWNAFLFLCGLFI